MATETEMKLPVDDLAPVEARLKRLRAEPLGQFVQDDMFFDSPQRRLLAADCGLRLRTLQQPDPPGPQRKYVLTYKGARQARSIKQREEIEVEVADAKAMIDVLDRLGFGLMLHLQKRRRRYRLNDCFVELDTLPVLGHFVEIEGPSEDLIHKVARKLDLDPLRSITDSYASLLMSHARLRGLPLQPAKFLLPD